MQRNQLAAKQILSRRNALRDGDSLHASISDQPIDAPFPSRIEAVLCDLEPARCFALCVSLVFVYVVTAGGGVARRTSRPSIGLCVGYFFQIGHHRALMACVDHVVGA